MTEQMVTGALLGLWLGLVVGLLIGALVTAPHARAGEREAKRIIAEARAERVKILEKECDMKPPYYPFGGKDVRIKELEAENERLKAELGEAGSPPPGGSLRQRLERAEARIEELEAENERLKRALDGAIDYAAQGGCDCDGPNGPCPLCVGTRLLAENESLEQTIDRADEHTKGLMEEIERLKGDLEREASIAVEVTDLEARIEAALAKIARIVESLEPDDIEIDHMQGVAEALRGEVAGE